jgi:hypothetical protein
MQLFCDCEKPAATAQHSYPTKGGTAMPACGNRLGPTSHAFRLSRMMPKDLLGQTCLSSLSFRLHRFFAADDVAGIDAPTDLIDHYAEAANTAFISLTLLHTLPRTLFCYFLRYLLLSHDFLLL